MADEWGTPQWAENTECDCGLTPIFKVKRTNVPGTVKNMETGQVGETGKDPNLCQPTARPTKH
jgi:hypothetical protein